MSDKDPIILPSGQVLGGSSSSGPLPPVAEVAGSPYQSTTFHYPGYSGSAEAESSYRQRWVDYIESESDKRVEPWGQPLHKIKPADQAGARWWFGFGLGFMSGIGFQGLAKQWTTSLGYQIAINTGLGLAAGLVVGALGGIDMGGGFAWGSLTGSLTAWGFDIAEAFTEYEPSWLDYATGIGGRQTYEHIIKPIGEALVAPPRAPYWNPGQGFFPPVR